MTADNAVHTAGAAAILHDIVRLDIRSLYCDISDQARWPPLSAIVQLPAIAVLGPTEPGHRIGILIWVLPTGLALAWAAAVGSHERWRWAAAALAVTLFLGCATALETATNVVLEIPGLGFMLATYAAAISGWQSSDRRLLRWASFLLTVVWFTKWQYGTVCAAACLAAWLWMGRPGGWRGALRVFGLPAAALAVWLASPYHLREFLMYMTWSFRETGVRALRALVFAPRSYHVILALMVLGIIVAMFNARRYPIRVALLTHIAFASSAVPFCALHLRSALWIDFPAWALAACGWGDIIGRLLSPRRAYAASVAALLLAMGVAANNSLSRARWYMALPVPVRDGYVPAAQFAVRTVPLGARLLTVGGWWRFISAWHLRWQYIREYWDQRFALRDLPISDWPALVWDFYKVRWRSPLAILYIRRPARRPPGRRLPPEYVAAFYLYLGDPKVDDMMREIRKRYVLREVARRTFPSGSRVEIYRVVESVGAGQ